LLTVRSVVIAAGQGGGPRVVACGVGFHWPRVTLNTMHDMAMPITRGQARRRPRLDWYHEVVA
jgi:hypothetical protein